VTSRRSEPSTKRVSKKRAKKRQLIVRIEHERPVVSDPQHLTREEAEFNAWMERASSKPKKPR
jgi:hypothetical protein